MMGIRFVFYRILIFFFPFLPLFPLLPPSLVLSPLFLAKASSHVQCSLPDLNREQPSPVIPAGPQTRATRPIFPPASAASVSGHTSIASLCSQYYLLDLNHDLPRSAFSAGPQASYPRSKFSNRPQGQDKMSERMPERKAADISERMIEEQTECQKECQKIYRKKYQIERQEI